MLAALLAAAMSSVSSGINSIAAVVSSDWLGNSPGQGTPDPVKRLRTISLMTGGAAICGALAVNELMLRADWNFVDLMERINHLFVAPLGALFFAGICLKKVGPTAALAGFAVGVAVSIAISFSEALLDYNVSFMWIMPASFAASLVTAAACGWACPRNPSEQNPTRGVR